jgi:hypothetical protein
MGITKMVLFSTPPNRNILTAAASLKSDGLFAVLDKTPNANRTLH